MRAALPKRLISVQRTSARVSLARGVAKKACMSSRNGTADGATVSRFRPLGRLPARVVELHPAGVPLRVAARAQALSEGQMLRVFDHHVAGFAQCAPVDHDVARDAQANAAVGPGPVQARKLRRGDAFGRAQRLGHCGLEQPVLDKRAVRQG
jgi:hypothetical protein